MLHFSWEGHRFLWFGASWSSMAGWSPRCLPVPPLPPMCRRCLPEISLVKKYLVKKSHEKWSAKYCKFGSQMGCQIGPEIEDNVNNAFDGGWQSQVSTTRIKKWWKIMKCRPWKAWFWCPLSSENAVATFPDLLEMSSTWHPNGLQIGAGGCLWDQKVGKSGAWKTSQKMFKKKHWDLFKNGPKRGSQKSGRFVIFQGPIPAWSLGCPWGGS